MRRTALVFVPFFALVSPFAAVACDRGSAGVAASPLTSDASVASTGASASAGAGAGASASAVIDASAPPIANLALPAAYDPSKPAPLLVALPGYGVTAAKQEVYWKLGALAKEQGFLYATPEPRRDKRDIPFWNATDACCDFFGAKGDDVARIVALLDAIAARHRVDPKRVYLIGHSNGAFLAHRIACEQSTRIAAIVSLAGATWKDATRCTPSDHVAILQAHGTNDDVVKVDGGRVFDRPSMAPYPSLRETLATWTKNDDCTGALHATGAKLDLDARVPGAETEVSEVDGCPRGGEIVLWSMKGSVHVPKLAPGWAEAVFAFLLAHPKP